MSSQRLSLEIEASPAYEVLMTLCVVSDVAQRDAYEIGRPWFDTVRARAGSALLTAVLDFCGQSDRVWAHLLSLAYESPAPRDVPTFLGYLSTVDATEVRLRLLGYYLRYFRRTTPPDVMAAAAAGDPEASRRLLKSSDPTNPEWQAALRTLLSTEPEPTKLRLLDLLRRWHEQVFMPMEPEILPIIRRDAETWQDLANTLSPLRLIETAAQGYEYVPEPGIERVLLIPSFVLRPQIHSLDHHEVKILVHPVGDESLTPEGDAPPRRLVRLTKALADERRIRVLKRLTTGSYTLQELADHFGVGNTTMFHHMVILRSAGLVHLRSAGKRYSLRPETLAEVGELLERYFENA